MKQKLLTQNLKSFMAKNIGTHFYISQLGAVKGTNKYNAVLGVSIPKVICDDEAKKQYVKFLKFNDVYTLDFELGVNGINAVYNLDVIYDNVAKNEMRLKHTISNFVLDKIYPNLINVDLIKNNLRPIYVILLSLFNKQVLENNFTSKLKNKERYEEYIKFLIDYGIMRINSEGDYVVGNVPIELQDAIERKNEEEVLRYSFGYVLKDGRKYLKEELHLHMLDVFLSIITSYYYLSLKVGKLIKITDDTFRLNCSGSHDSTINKSKFLSYLQDLISAGILFKKEDYYFGDGNLLDKLAGEKSLYI